MFERSYLENIIRNAPIGIITTDLERRITFVSDLARETCRAGEGVIGEPIEGCVADSPAMRHQLDEVLAGRTQRVVFELEVRTPAGPRTMKFTATLLRDDAYAPIGLLLMCEDVTDRKQLEERITEAKRLESLGLLAGGIAHQFNNLLSGAMGYASLLKSKLDPASAHYRYADSIESSATQAKELTAQLLAFARGGQYEVRSLNLNQTVLEAVRMLRLSMPRTVKLTTRLSSRLSRVEADPTQMHQLITNVFTNAVEAMPAGGRVTIRTENVRLDGDAAGKGLHLDPGPYVHLTISDTGRGIPRDRLPKIFEPFYSTKGVGHGLGLSAVYGIVRNHHGAVTVESEEAAGTTVHVYLPASTAVRPGAPAGREGLAKGRETVLVVDDEAIIRDLLDHALEDLGYKVILARDGEEGLDIFRRQHDAIDCVLLDMVLPNMDGAEVYAAMRKLKPGVQVILCTGYSLQGPLDEMLKQGVAGVLRKPFQIEELSAALRGVLDKNAPAGPR